jgi:hypothetical protein
MITIFCEFRQFSAKKLAVFSKTNVMIKILHNLALFWVKKCQFFRWIFRRKYLKNHNIGPGAVESALKKIELRSTTECTCHPHKKGKMLYIYIPYTYCTAKKCTPSIVCCWSCYRIRGTILQSLIAFNFYSFQALNANACSCFCSDL